MSSIYPDLPRVAVGAVVFKDGKVLLIRRGKAPSKGEWAIPGGSVRLGETLQEAAEREISEETGIVIKADNPIYTFDTIEKDENGQIRFHYVVIDLIAEYISGEPVAADDVTDARWVSVSEMENLKVNFRTTVLISQILHNG